ncbi:hypothetical protein [Nostoc sp. JL31]|uniref:hypothetical protein n=1 Tax=Nostoc sp. JL31 TaxID=2815395 RepID=UPI0025E027D3|nr:hypothetical protein [Nostoc sp. JL31]
MLQQCLIDSAYLTGSSDRTHIQPILTADCIKQPTLIAFSGTAWERGRVRLLV